MNKKTVLVTGSSIGLGASIIRKFASNNYNVIINYNTNMEKAEQLANELNEKYKTDYLLIKCDITNEQEVQNMYNIIKEKFGTLDVLVNNAGIAIDTTFEDKTKENFRKTLELNLTAPFFLTRLFADDMYNNKQGKIINISSTNAIDSYYEFSLDYDASKAALINLTHNLANHYSPYINVNCVCPGWINTPMNQELSEEFKQKEINKILLNRFADPEEIANLVYFLSTDEASYINDSIIKIDGGVKHD